MKKIILLGVFAFSSMLNAQISKGNWLVGSSVFYGNIGNSENTTTYSNSPTEYNSEGNSFQIGLSPNIGYFVVNKLAVGASVGLDYYNSKSTSSNSTTFSTTESKYNNIGVSIGPFVRYYFVENQKWSPYVQADFGYGISPSKQESKTFNNGVLINSSNTDSNKYNYWNAGFKFGMAYFLNSNVALQFYTGFTYSSTDSSYDYKPSSGVGYTYEQTYNRWNVPIGVGLQIHLGGSAKKE